jgi:nucleoside-diphosphate-sugar epimerase
MLDATMAERELGWSPQGFHESLDRAVRWALAQRAATGNEQRPH